MTDLLVVSIIMLPIVLAIAVEETKHVRNYTKTLAYICVLQIFIAAQVFFAEHNILFTRPIMVGAWLCALIAAMKPLLSRESFLESARWLGITVCIPLTSFLVWLHPYIKNSSIRNGAPFSNANNDLAIYIISADNFIHAGFKEFSRVVGYQAGALANFEVAGSSSFISFISRLSNQTVWRSTNSSMLVLIALSITCLYVLLRRWMIPPFIAMFSAVWAMSSSYARLPQQNYFLSQSISRLALFSALLGLDFVMRGKSKSFALVGVMMIFSSTWLSLVTYPAGSISSLVVLFAALISYAIVGFVYKQPKNEIWVRLLLILGGLVMPLPLLINRWSLIQSNVSLYSRVNVTGWPAPTTFLPDWIGIPSLGPVWITWCVSGVAIILFLIAVSKLHKAKDPIVLTSFFLLMTILFAHIALALKLQSDAYQVWKFLATVQPIAICSLVAFIALSPKPLFYLSSRASGIKTVSGLSLAGLMLLIGGNSIASSKTYISITQKPSMELESAADQPSVHSPNLLIRLDPYLETMIAPVILNLHDAIYASDTYLGPASPEDPRCAISHSGDLNSVKVGERLFIGPASVCR